MSHKSEAQCCLLHSSQHSRLVPRWHGYLVRMSLNSSPSALIRQKTRRNSKIQSNFRARGQGEFPDLSSPFGSLTAVPVINWIKTPRAILSINAKATQNQCLITNALTLGERKFSLGYYSCTCNIPLGARLYRNHQETAPLDEYRWFYWYTRLQKETDFLKRT